MDNQIRCGWVMEGSDVYKAYHDTEWGVPSYEDSYLFEMLLLESFQAGLSWITILKKRENFRKAFDKFDFHVIAEYDEQKKQELKEDAGIIRNRLKIEAAVINAKIFLEIQEQCGSFSAYLWGFTDGMVVYGDGEHFPVSTELSNRISKDLKKRGMKFVGTTIIYSYLQAVGIVNDHSKECFKYKKNQNP